MSISRSISSYALVGQFNSPRIILLHLQHDEVTERPFQGQTHLSETPTMQPSLIEPERACPPRSPSWGDIVYKKKATAAPTPAKRPAALI